MVPNDPRILPTFEGRFRLVSSHIQTLCNPQRVKTEGNVRAVLKSLPEELEETYAIIMEQISLQEQPNPTMALTAPRWLICAQNRMTAKVLLDAVHSGSAGEALDLSIETLVDICCNFIIYDRFSRIFRFTHLSVREYLETKGHCIQSPSNAVVLHRCLDVNSWSAEGGFFDARYEDLYQYAEKYWWLHFRRTANADIGPELESKLKKFYLQNALTYTSFIRRLLNSPGWASYEFEDLERLSAVVEPTVSEFDMVFAADTPVTSRRFMQLILHPDLILDPRTPWHFSLLPFAVSKGDLAMTRFFIELGASMTARNGKGETLLQIAIQTKSLGITQYLLEIDVAGNYLQRDWLRSNVAFEDLFYLSLAVRAGDGGIVVELLKYGHCEEDVRKAVFASLHSGSHDFLIPFLQSGAYVPTLNDFEDLLFHVKKVGDEQTIQALENIKAQHYPPPYRPDISGILDTIAKLRLKYTEQGKLEQRLGSEQNQVAQKVQQGFDQLTEAFSKL